jgi:glycosyltransferase involved in cell wall biosynthesis
MIRVLHITTHLGGGVGKVLSSICLHSKKTDSEYIHEIILLEQPQNNQFVDIVKASGTEITIAPNYEEIEKKMIKADIVQLEWWHHPKMAEFLSMFPNIPVRLIIWSHISGCFPPIIVSNFIMMSSRFLFTSHVSKENIYLKDLESEFMKSHTDVVYSSGGFNNLFEIKPKIHKGFNIGYLGTLNFVKLHPEFLDFCAEVNIPEARFILVGDRTTQTHIEKKAKEKGLYNQFQFIGYTNEVREQFSKFDVFGYPLNPEHYGTTENALLEAMASGIPPVVLCQCTEKYLVKHMETGIIVSNKEEYGKAIHYLYEKPTERKRIGNNARNYVMEVFALEKTVENLNRNYNITMNHEKQLFSFDNVFGRTPAEWFLTSLGVEGEVFKKSMNLQQCSNEGEIAEVEQQIIRCRQSLKEKSKSSVYHFQQYFTEDKWLAYWADLLDKCNE